jgi:HD-GYP domain-containing protein (c-di-GMP phosphodiesterase class II)
MGRGTSVKQIKHAVQGIVDQVLHNETSLGGLSALKDYDDYTFTHSVNTCIFCVAIGKRLGLTKRQLYDLGLAALVHDLGMSRIPVDILVKGTRLSQEEEKEMRAHTWLGALSVFNLRDYGGIPYQSMIVAYEHHMKPDLMGYPEVIRPRRQSIFSKIIAVAGAFDAATNTRSYQAARPPDEVLRELWEEEHLGFDPVIVKALINLLGIYPVGTCVILDTLELALVYEANSDPDFVHRPIVRVLSDQDGIWLAEPFLADLADTDDEGTFLRSIIKVTDPARYGVSVSDYLG